MITTRYHVAIATAALALLLTGCTGGGSGPAPSKTEATSAPPAAAQSKTEACAIVQGDLQEFVALSGEVDASDPQAVVDGFSSFIADANASLDEITNTELQPSAAKLKTAYTDYLSYVKLLVSAPDEAAELEDPVAKLQTVITEISTVCGS